MSLPTDSNRRRIDTDSSCQRLLGRRRRDARLRRAHLASLVGIMAIVFAAVATPLVSGSPIAQEPGHSVIPVGSGSEGDGAWQVEISDDGRYIVYQANLGDGWKQRLYDRSTSQTRELGELGELAYFGTFSPNGEWLAFGKKAWLWKMPVAGGEPTLVYHSNSWESWDGDDHFVISRGTDGLWRVPTDGSLRRERISTVDTSGGATNYNRPTMLPGRRGVLVSVGFGTGNANRQLGIVSLPDGKLTIYADKAVTPRYAESGHILYARGDELRALPFDPERMEVTGEPATVIDGIHVYPNTGAQFDISRNGVLVYVPGESYMGRANPRRIVWVSRSGEEEPFDTANMGFGQIRMSPDGRYVAAQVSGDMMLYDRRSGGWSMVADGGGIGAPVWAPDSSALFYSRNGVLIRQELQSGAEPVELSPAGGQFWGHSVSADGTEIIGTRDTRVSANPEWPQHIVSAVPVEGGAAPRPILGPGARTTWRAPAVSPDGSWVAYVEKQNHLDRVYVQPFPDGGAPVLVSEGGIREAAEPVWGRDSSELFYRDTANMVSVTLALDSEVPVVARESLFSIRKHYKYLNTFAATYDYDPSTDRFLVPRWVLPNPPGEGIHVIENAFEMLERLAPGR